jgi:hypothetical protein
MAQPKTTTPCLATRSALVPSINPERKGKFVTVQVFCMRKWHAAGKHQGADGQVWWA